MHSLLFLCFLDEASYEDIVMDIIDSSPSSSLPPLKPIGQWVVEDVLQWLEEIGMSQYRDSFRDNAIDGEELQTLTHDTMANALKIGKYGGGVGGCGEGSEGGGRLGNTIIISLFC